MRHLSFISHLLTYLIIIMLVWTQQCLCFLAVQDAPGSSYFFPRPKNSFLRYPCFYIEKYIYIYFFQYTSLGF